MSLTNTASRSVRLHARSPAPGGASPPDPPSQPALESARERERMLGAAAEQLDRAAAVIAQYAIARKAGVEPTAALATASQRVTGPDAGDAVEAARGAGLLPPAREHDGAIAVEADDSGTLLAAELEGSCTPGGDEPLLTVAIGGGLLAEMTPSEAEGVLAQRQDCARERLRGAQEAVRRMEGDIDAAEAALARLLELREEEEEEEERAAAADGSASAAASGPRRPTGRTAAARHLGRLRDSAAAAAAAVGPSA